MRWSSSARHRVSQPLPLRTLSGLPHKPLIAAMQRSKQLLALGARLRQAAAAGGSGSGAASRAWQPANQQQLLSLKTLASSCGAPATAATHAGSKPAAAVAAAGRQQAAAAGRRSFAADAVARPGPAPRGTSKAGKP